jgi:anhydro-N-acetylmuramic acid kinase
MLYLQMNPEIARLYQLADANKRLILGMMSGTSLDGLDLALCEFTNSGLQTSVQVIHFTTIPYEPSFRDLISRVFAKQVIHQADLSGLHAEIANHHARFVLQALAQWGVEPQKVDVLASHGQTVFHAPQSIQASFSQQEGEDVHLYPSNTFQIGDGDHLAVKTGIITLSDFRQKHVAAGGEGAPLALYGDYLLFSSELEDRILLNLGGIANYTYLPSAANQQQSMKPFATDVGPANTLMNQYMKRHFGLDMDVNGAMAAQGTVHKELLNALLNHPFFALANPKTTGPELFNLHYLDLAMQASQCADLSHEDVLATLAKFSTTAVVNSIRVCAAERPYQSPLTVYASGGGVSNPVIMKHLSIGLDAYGVELKTFEALGVHPDAKEAVLFAALANETLAGSPDHVAALSGTSADASGLVGAPAVCMGKISLPR